jgi:FtsH-binding integral membrane protein
VRSRREIPAVQVVGYRLLGVSLIICGVALFAAVLHKLGGSQLGVTELLVLIFAGAIFYGVMSEIAIFRQSTINLAMSLTEQAALV